MLPTKPPKLGNSGLLLVEILLAVAIMSMMSVVILTSLIYGRESTAIAGDRTRAVQIANAAVAAVQNIAHDNYGNLASYTDGTDYYLDISASQWQLSTSVTTIDTIYTPKIVFSSGPNGSRQAAISVSWQQTSDRIGVISITTYFTDWQADTAYGPMMVVAYG